MISPYEGKRRIEIFFFKILIDCCITLICTEMQIHFFIKQRNLIVLQTFKIIVFNHKSIKQTDI